MKARKLAAAAGVILLAAGCQSTGYRENRPKIVIGLVVDQMRWDYLHRYSANYSANGFRRLLGEGFSCDQAFINYLPAYTAPGHSCIYTGSVPAIHGIAGNEWVDNYTGKKWYCVDDDNVEMTGDTEKGMGKSPANLLASTITDELRLATNKQSKVYGVALKDRSSILPAGHMANAAYWYNEKTGNFVSSTYYENPNPKWLQSFNSRRAGDSLVKQGWDLLYPPERYDQSCADDNAYEGAFEKGGRPVFPYEFASLDEEKRNGMLKTIPAGNSYTLMMARACMEGEQLGMGKQTDFLAISLSSTDYVGHRFAPNAMETEDTYLRLDADIAAFLHYLDERYGAGGYLLFLTADHGGAHNPHFMTDNKMPAGVMPGSAITELNEFLKGIFGVEKLVLFDDNYQACLDEQLIAGRGLDRDYIKANIVNWLKYQPYVAFAVDMENNGAAALPEPIRTMAINGYNRRRSGPIQIVLDPAWFASDYTTGTTHGTWNPYDTHIPLVWYGWHIAQGHTNRLVHMTDIAPTLAAMLHIQLPNGCIGQPIFEK